MKDTLHAIGWSVAEAARRAGVRLRTMERWAAGGTPAPPAVLEWLAAVRAAVDSVPPPATPDTWPARAGRPVRRRAQT